MSKCARSTCFFIKRSESEKFCCKGCKHNGVHGPVCEGISFKASPDTMVAAEFDLALCKASQLADFSIVLRIGWTAVPNATCYKLLRGGDSPIVLNSFYNNTYINQTGCFESNSDARMTKNVKEYLTINTNYSFSFAKAAFTAPNPLRKHLTFLVYPYFGNVRGPAPTKVLCVDFHPTPGVDSSYTGICQLRPNISVSIAPGPLALPESLRHNLYEFYNPVTEKRDFRQVAFRRASLSGAFTFELANNSLQVEGAIESKTLFAGVGGSPDGDGPAIIPSVVDPPH